MQIVRVPPVEVQHFLGRHLYVLLWLIVTGEDIGLRSREHAAALLGGHPGSRNALDPLTFGGISHPPERLVVKHQVRDERFDKLVLCHRVVRLTQQARNGAVTHTLEIGRASCRERENTTHVPGSSDKKERGDATWHRTP